MLEIIITIGTFITMEGVAWFIHKYIMHGFGWCLHEDHHQPGYPYCFEKNDSFSLFFIILSMTLFYFGVKNDFNCLFFFGLGILLYGIAYFLVHDVIIHRRFRWFNNVQNRYFQALRKAHKLHHKSLEKKDGKYFGMLFIPIKHFKKVHLITNNKKNKK